MLGFKGQGDWRDMSEYLVHFTKDQERTDAYTSMLAILSSGRLLPSGPFGAAAELVDLEPSQRSACFSEIPLDQLRRLVDQRSRYGIAFRQSHVIRAGGGRVWYLDDEGALAATVQKILSERSANLDPSDDLWKLTPFIDPPVDGGWFDFAWEREWRVPGALDFKPDDVAFLFIPEELHDNARSFFASHVLDNSGPGYFCPYLDPTWSDEQIQAALGPNSEG